MYIPEHFAVDDRDEIFSFIAANAFGQLVSNVDGRSFSTHLPLTLNADKSSVYAHIARVNPQHKSIEGQQVLLTFAGPHDYISPSWYVSTGVPTWNYQAVHIYGKCRTFDEPERLKGVVDELTQKYEAGFEMPWQPDYPASMLRGIVGLEIAIEEIQAKYKLNQNRPNADREGVIKQLEYRGSNALAKAMRKVTKPDKAD